MDLNDTEVIDFNALADTGVTQVRIGLATEIVIGSFEAANDRLVFNGLAGDNVVIQS